MELIQGNYGTGIITERLFISLPHPDYNSNYLTIYDIDGCDIDKVINVFMTDDRGLTPGTCDVWDYDEYKIEDIPKEWTSNGKFDINEFNKHVKSFKDIK